MSQPETTRTPSPYPPPGTIIDGKYQVERILGEGGMGAVAKATHLLRRAPVALKFMSPAMMISLGANERFLNEGVAASQIDSDHVVKILDVGTLSQQGGVPYLVMEFLEGIDLSFLLVRDGQPGLEVPRAVHFILQALRGLQVAHAAGIIHRDMKPSNCFVVTKDGEPHFVKLVDFGISKVVQPGGGVLTKTNSALGTPLYMSPEQARKPRDVDSRTDLYSVAVILFELLSGTTPFTAESGEYTEILFKIFTQDPPNIRTLCPHVPEGLAVVLHHAMARDPNARYSTAVEMGEALTPWADARSALVLSRLRSAGSRSHAPPSFVPPPQSVVPPAPEARADSATAQTLSDAVPSIPAPPMLPGPGPTTQPAVRTDMAASRDAGRREMEAPVADRRRTTLAIGFVVAMLVMSLVGGTLMVRARMRTTSPEPDASPQVATAPTTNGLPPAASTLAAVSAPAASAPGSAAPPPATPTAATVARPVPPPATTSAERPPGPPPGPGQLKDIRPAQ